MKENKGLSKSILSKIKTDKREDQKTISYSQYSVFSQCKYRWYLTYAKKMLPFSSSINTVFGTAIHETIQEYLIILFEQGIKTSDNFLWEAVCSLTTGISFSYIKLHILPAVLK